MLNLPITAMGSLHSLGVDPAAVEETYSRRFVSEITERFEMHSPRLDPLARRRIGRVLRDHPQDAIAVADTVALEIARNNLTGLVDGIAYRRPREAVRFLGTAAGIKPLCLEIWHRSGPLPNKAERELRWERYIHKNLSTFGLTTYVAGSEGILSRCWTLFFLNAVFRKTHGHQGDALMPVVGSISTDDITTLELAGFRPAGIDFEPSDDLGEMRPSEAFRAHDIEHAFDAMENPRWLRIFALLFNRDCLLPMCRSDSQYFQILFPYTARLTDLSLAKDPSRTSAQFVLSIILDSFDVVRRRHPDLFAPFLLRFSSMAETYLQSADGLVTPAQRPDFSKFEERLQRSIVFLTSRELAEASPQSFHIDQFRGQLEKADRGQ